MASFWSLLGTFMALIASSSAASHQLHHVFTISAAPSSLPLAPLSSPVTIPTAPATVPDAPEPHSPSPAFSPDITPLLPSPKGGAATPSADSSLPVIPSSPSPPNPDGEASGGPVSNPLSSSAVEPTTASSGSVRSEALSFFSLAVYSMQLVGVLVPRFAFSSW